MTRSNETADRGNQARALDGRIRRIILSTLRTTMIRAYFAVAGALGGYIGARVASVEFCA